MTVDSWSMRRRFPFTWWLAATGLLMLAALHFSLVLVSLLPPGAPAAARRVAYAYVTPLFAQNWWLFAPDPPRIDRLVEARGGYVAGGRRAFTPWVPITEPLVRAVRANRFSRHNAAWIAVLNATYNLTADATLLRLRGGARDLVLSQWTDPERQPSALVVLERAASATLANAYRDHAFESVQVRIVITRVPPFRACASATTEPPDELVFPAVPFITDVEPWNLPQ